MSKIEELSQIKAEEVEVLIEEVKNSNIGVRESELLEKLLRTLLWLVSVIERKRISLKNLQRILFGKKSEKNSGAGTAPPPSEEIGSEETEVKKENEESIKGHGRRPISSYTGAKKVKCEHNELKVGASCPGELCGGRLYELNEPVKLIQFVGQPMLEATNYERQVLRCPKCQHRYTAALPEGVSEEKYTASCDATIAMMKYGASVPWYRQSQLLESAGIGLADTVLWERCEEMGNVSHPVYLLMERMAGNSDLIYGDDTTITILSKKQEKKYLAETERKGTFASGLVCELGEQKITLYMCGCKHTGENINELLSKRSPQLPVPIQMGDALASNWTGDAQRICAKCLVHARRNFYEIKDKYPTECGYVLKKISGIYRYESETKAMSAEARLKYHKKHSGPIMKELREWMETQLSERKVEPNSVLGGAIKYFLKHFPELSAFLKVSGCPLDNNEAERALKKFVIFRKNSLFFKTDHGGAIGAILMSLIETCRENNIDPWKYLVWVRSNKAEVRKNPEKYLPWNYGKAGEVAAVT